RQQRGRAHKRGQGVLLEPVIFGRGGVPQWVVREAGVQLRREQEHGGRGFHRVRLVDRERRLSRPKQSRGWLLSVFTGSPDLRGSGVHSRVFWRQSDERERVLRRAQGGQW